MIVLGLLSLLLLSCRTFLPSSEVTTAEKTPEPVDLVTLLNQDSVYTEREEPFTIRPFEPYLDSVWIGNAVSYGPFREGQAPDVVGPSEAEILEDLTIMKEHWNLIRVYGSDDDSERILKVIHENQLPIRVMLGIWLENEIIHPELKAKNINQVIQGIDLANRYQNEVIAINVGNETQVWWSGHRTYPFNLKKYIRIVREHTHVPITTADDYNFWNKPESKEIAAEIDFIVLHAYALWNGQLLAHAITWVDSVYQDAISRHPDKTMVLGETGWATVYNPERDGPGEQGSLMKGEVSVSAQEKFFRDQFIWTEEQRITTFWFEAFDEPWKGGGTDTGPIEVEKNWGVFNKDRSPKESFQNVIQARVSE